MYRQGAVYENLTKANFIGEGEYNIPIIKPENITAEKFIGFNYAKTSKEQSDTCVHFFVDDYQFARVWNNPDRYIKLLSEFKCVCTPDFSTYVDYPKAVQIYNHFRKHWLGAYWQMCGIKVVPTISWSDKGSFEWCFDGEPKHGTVAVSSVGAQSNRNSKDLFLSGYDEMMKRLMPETVIFYGTIPKECYGNIVGVLLFTLKPKIKIGEKL